MIKRRVASFGVLRTDVDGCVEEFVEKPADAFPYSRRGRCLINLGVYVFSTSSRISAFAATPPCSLASFQGIVNAAIALAAPSAHRMPRRL